MGKGKGREKEKISPLRLREPVCSSLRRIHQRQLVNLVPILAHEAPSSCRPPDSSPPTSRPGGKKSASFRPSAPDTPRPRPTTSVPPLPPCTSLVPSSNTTPTPSNRLPPLSTTAPAFTLIPFPPSTPTSLRRERVLRPEPKGTPPEVGVRWGKEVAVVE